MHPALTQLQHRPWSLPESSWSWRQSWNDLLFVHYRVDSKSVRDLVPKALKIQEYDGSTWVGIVPFQMNGVMRRPFPNLPGFSNFLELNVRLYVEHEGKPGVWFLSLDATNPVVVWGGNQFFCLPYKNAKITRTSTENFGHYISRRRDRNEVAEFEVSFQPAPEVFHAKPGTLEFFLTERYCFYACDSNYLYRAEVHHWQWPLQRAQGQVIRNSIVNGIKIDEITGPIFHYSKGVDVVSWTPIKV